MRTGTKQHKCRDLQSPAYFLSPQVKEKKAVIIQIARCQWRTDRSGAEAASSAGTEEWLGCSEEHQPDDREQDVSGGTQPLGQSMLARSCENSV